MNTPPISDDADTDRLLGIVAWNLTRFFGYPVDAAVSLVRSDYQTRDDDFYHHEGAFRSAAFIHYAAAIGSPTDLGGFGIWYRTQNFADSEREALEHYRETYFQTN